MHNNLLLANPAGDENDPHFENVTLLLQGDGTNGGQNNTFVDSSTNNFTITRNGNTTQGSFSPYGDLWSNYFDGTGDSIQTSTGSISIGTGNFTIECWVFPISSSQSAAVFDTRSGTTSNRPALGYVSSTFRYFASSDDRITSAANYPANQWYHVAAVRNSGTTTLYINGVSAGTYTDSTDYGTATRFMIGADDDGSSNAYFSGYVSNARFATTAVYTSAFTPPTAPLTAITNTSLLTCQSNRFRDASSNNFTITRNGDVSVQRFSPFSPTDAYSAATIGGSGYFDGTGDTLQVPYTSALAVGTGAYSFEAWVYFTGSGTNQGVIGTVSDGFAGFEMSSNNWAYYYGTAGTGTGVAVIRGQWNHVVICRNSSGNGAFFVNGSRLATFTDTANKTGFGNLQIGYNGVAGGAYTTGYISEYRYVQGNPYNPTQSTLSVPTSPLTAITNTAVLLNFTNASIFDNAMMADLETVGNAQIDTAVKKFGTGSLEFDGTGDYLTAPSNQAFAFGTGDFTIEAWVYITSGSKTQVIFDTRNSGTSAPGIALAIDTANKPYVYLNNATLITSSLALSLNTWTHIACVKSAGTITLYLDGTSRGSASSSTSLTDTSCTVATAVDYRGTNSDLKLVGYIDDLRITKGVARYTANFTPPTQSLPTK